MPDKHVCPRTMAFQDAPDIVRLATSVQFDFFSAWNVRGGRWRRDFVFRPEVGVRQSVFCIRDVGFSHFSVQFGSQFLYSRHL